MRKKRIFIVIHKTYLNIFSIILLLAACSLSYLLIINSNNNFNSKVIANDYVSPVVVKKQMPKLAIIIDDFGQNRNGVKEMMQMGKHLTFAILPFMKYSRSDALNAHQQGYEVIVHLPMQSQDEDIESWLGPRPVKLNQSDDEIRNIVQDSLKSIPYAVGVNIHMGTKSSENKRVMTCVMDTTKSKNMYFVDSKTSSHSICSSIADKIGLKYTERNIFLETTSNKSKEFVKQQLISAAELSLERGAAVVIGHVGSAGGKVTAETIKEMIPFIENKGIKLVYVSELFD